MRKKTIDTIPVLSDSIKTILNSLSRSRSLPTNLTKRSFVILMASEGYSNQNIATKMGMHYNSIAIWRNRFLEALPALRELEASSPERLFDEIKTLLSDKQRPGCPSKYTKEQISKIVELSGKLPSEFGYEAGQWSLHLLAEEIKRQGIADQISLKSVSRFIKMKQT